MTGWFVGVSTLGRTGCAWSTPERTFVGVSTSERKSLSTRDEHSSMDGTAFLEEIETELRTELSRIGSSKSLYADTVGEMDSDAVLAAGADNAGHAADTVASWATDSEHDVFDDAGDRIQGHYEELTAELDGYERGESPAAVVACRAATDDPERLGALVGWSLITERKSTQSSGFFTGQADPGTASTFRSFGDDYEAIREQALDTLETVCSSDEKRERALSAGTAVVEAAYDEYFETLEALGMNPKPVC